MTITTPTTPLDGALVEPLMLDRTCPIAETDAMIARKAKIWLIAIGEASYTCKGQLDPAMPPFTWTHHDVRPADIAELHQWASAKEARLEMEAQARILPIAQIVQLAWARGGVLRVGVVTRKDATSFPTVEYEPRAALDEAERLRRFLIGLALPDMGARHVDDVLRAMRRTEERSFIPFPR